MANQTSSQSVNDINRPIRDSIQSSDFDFSAALQAIKLRRNRERARIEQQYGRLSDGDIGRVLRIEDEQAECIGCKGVCTKDFFRYKKPVAQAIDGLIYVTNIPCQFGVDSAFRLDCLKSGVPEKFIGRELCDYRITSDNARTAKMAKGFIENRPKRGVFFYGATGTGKTFLAAIIAQSFIRDGKRVAFFDMPALFDAIKHTFDTNESTADFLNKVCNADLLILDDMGTERVTDWTSEQLYLIVNRRYNANRPLVATSNFDLAGLERRLGNDLTARRITSRLEEMCAQAFFGTVDRRTANAR